MPKTSSTLTPPPGSHIRTGSTFPAPEPWTYSLAQGKLPGPAQKRLTTAIQRTGSRLERRDPGDAFLRIELDTTAANLGPEAYHLSLKPPSSDNPNLLIASSPAGLSYGLTTLAQIIDATVVISQDVTSQDSKNLAATTPHQAVEIHPVEIRDSPALANRGVMLDISRNRVPKQAELLARIEHLASLKINHLQLYMEHTFAYRGHEQVWRHDSPLTAEEIQELDAFCRERHIELAPNQNSFGHFHRWLVHDRYRPLAEVPAGIEHPFGPTREPFSLCATDSSVFTLLEDLYDQLLPNFTSETFNVGLDETLDLGLGRSAAAVALNGKHRVYLNYLNKVHRLVAERGRRMQYWGDIVLEQPQIVPELPKDATALIWGYERNHPFDEQCSSFAEAGVDFWVCPGTSSWLSFAGRAHNALGNLQAAADSAHRHGASGMLITDWGDWGHMQPPFASELGFLAGAAHTWNPSGCDHWGESHWRQALDQHTFLDPSGTLSQTAMDLGNVYRDTGTANLNASVLFSAFRFLQDDLQAPRYRGLSNRRIERTQDAIEHAIHSANGHQSRRSDAALLVNEMHWVAEQLQLACTLLKERLQAGKHAQLSTLPTATRGQLAKTLDHQWLRFEPLWHERSRPGGLRRTRGLFELWSQHLREDEPSP